MKDDTYDKQDVSDILITILVTKWPIQEKDEKSVLGNYEETRMLQSESNAKANVLVNIFIIQKRLDVRMLKVIWLSNCCLISA